MRTSLPTPTRRRFIIVSAIASVLLGGAGSMLLAMAAPRWLPRRTTVWYALGLNGKTTSWCCDTYSVSPTEPLSTGEEYADAARRKVFADDASLAGRPSMGFSGLGQTDVIDAGFPLRCVSAWRCSPPFMPYNQGTPVRTPECGFIELAARDPLDGPVDRWIPYLPLWPGLIGNALVWGGVIWVGIFGVRMLRDARRRRRGLCVRCGYDRTGIAPAAPCPECGVVPVGGSGRLM